MVALPERWPPEILNSPIGSGVTWVKMYQPARPQTPGLTARRAASGPGQPRCWISVGQRIQHRAMRIDPPCAPSSPASKPLWGTYSRRDQLPSISAPVSGTCAGCGIHRSRPHRPTRNPEMHLRPEGCLYVCGLWAYCACIRLQVCTATPSYRSPCLSELTDVGCETLTTASFAKLWQTELPT